MAVPRVLVKVSEFYPGFSSGLCAGECCSTSAEASWAQHSCLELAGDACGFLLSELNPGYKTCISLPLTLAAALGRLLRAFAVLELQCKHFLVFCQNNQIILWIILGQRKVLPQIQDHFTLWTRDCPRWKTQMGDTDSPVAPEAEPACHSPFKPSLLLAGAGCGPAC